MTNLLKVTRRRYLCTRIEEIARVNSLKAFKRINFKRRKTKEGFLKGWVLFRTSEVAHPKLNLKTYIFSGTIKSIICHVKSMTSQ